MKKHQSGFTLVEIAIVLVIIGLLLGGVLKGQEMIENAKIKNLRNDFNGVMAGFYAYRDRYAAIPGDDPNALARGWVGATAGNSSGTLAAATPFGCVAASAGENCQFWRHMRHAGFIAGAIDNSNPQNAYTGALGVRQGAAGVLGAGAAALPGILLCAGSIPGKAAAAVDSAFDDNNSQTGAVRSTDGGSNIAPGALAAVAVYQDTGADFYTICKTL